jgi:hypothetical protein
MANIYSEDYIFKFGSLIQYGVEYMQGFSTFADEFYTEFHFRKSELNDYGYSPDWVQWQKNNSSQIIQLYDELNDMNLIPTTPE